MYLYIRMYACMFEKNEYIGICGGLVDHVGAIQGSHGGLEKYDRTQACKGNSRGTGSRYIHIYTYIYLYIYMYVYIYTYMYKYIYM